MSLLVGTQITAVATAVLAAFAIVTAVLAGLAFRKQSTEVTILGNQLTDQREVNKRQTEVLELQARELTESLDQRKREASERRRAQAAAVFMWEEHVKRQRVTGKKDAMSLLGGTVARVRNSSNQPVYDASFSWHRGSAPWGDPDPLPTLMPGDEQGRERALPDDLPATVNPELFGAVLFFRDAAGVSWRARPEGQLDEIPPEQMPLRS